MTRIQRRFSIVIASFVFGAVLSTGCASKDRVTYDNYTKIRTSVHTADDVVALLGEPDSKLPELWIYQRPDAHLTVMVDFDEKGNVSRTQWIDAMGETWHDTKEKK